MATNQYRIAIPLTNRGAVVFTRPCGDGAEWQTSFERIANALVREYTERGEGGVSKERRDGATAWLERVAYDLLLPMLEDDQLDTLKAWIAAHGRYSRRSMSPDLNPMQIGLMALFAHEAEAMSSQVRERMSKRLWYASRHYVPVEFLAGFFKQLDSAGLRERIAANEIEATFDSWVVQRRSTELALDRGPYPARIEDAVGIIVTAREDADEWDRVELR